MHCLSWWKTRHTLAVQSAQDLETAAYDENEMRRKVKGMANTPDYWHLPSPGGTHNHPHHPLWEVLMEHLCCYHCPS